MMSLLGEATPAGKGRVMNKTPIEYLDFTWNPIAMRCTEVSEGCAHCWHLKIAHRFKSNPKFSDEVRAAYAGGEPVLIEERLLEPMRRKRPARIGVQFMGDLFGDVPLGMVERIWHRMEVTPWHTFIVLTKRPEKMRVAVGIMEQYSKSAEWPPPNIFLGVTAENQARLIQRQTILREIPAAVRFISAEPLLGKLWFGRWALPAIDWVIAGAETGPGARHMHPNWARMIRDQCKAAGTPFFFKRMSPGEETPDDLMIREFPGEGE